MHHLFYGLLAAALLVALLGVDVQRAKVLRAQRIDCLLLIVALLMAGASEILLPSTLGLLLLATIYLMGRHRSITHPWLLFGGDAAIVVLAIALGLHLVPGIESWRLASDVVVSPDARSINVNANFDKGIAGLFLLNLLVRPSQQGLSHLSASGRFALIVAGVIAVWLIAAVVGVGWQPKWPELVYLFALNNLLFTCIAEEALFRGLIQGQLMARLRQFTWGAPLALLLASLVFGAVHLPGGLLWAAFATLAGLVYGLAYWLTGRISAAVLAHLAVNLGHFCLFVYPMG